MNLETKITIYKFTPQLFTLTPFGSPKKTTQNTSLKLQGR